MDQNKIFDAIIIGGSYAGLSAAMALGRSLRSVLIVDSGKPCNRQTPRAHNIITQDGNSPGAITEKARQQVLEYPTVTFLSDLVTTVTKTEEKFTVDTSTTKSIEARKILFATGVKDVMPDIKGFAECWGISVLHCPYCHGYEVAHQELGIIANGAVAFELCKLIQHWTGKLTLFTNGEAKLDSADQMQMIEKLGIEVVEKEITELEHEAGYIRQISFTDGSAKKVDAVFSRTGFEQHSHLPAKLGCRLDEHGYFEVNKFQKTNVPGVFGAGDMTTPFRAVTAAMAAGTIAGAMMNMEMINEDLPEIP